MLKEGDVVSCTALGVTSIYLFKNSLLHRFPNAAIYKSWGSPKPNIEESGECPQYSKCFGGADMQLNTARTCTNTIGKDCDVAHGQVLMGSQLTGCCPCRKADKDTRRYKSAASDSSDYGLGPDCSGGGTFLGKDTTLQYSGAKITVKALQNQQLGPYQCPPGDYAMVVEQESRRGAVEVHTRSPSAAADPADAHAHNAGHCQVGVCWPHEVLPSTPMRHRC